MSRRSLGLDDAVAAYVEKSNPPEHPALRRCREETARRDDAEMQIGREQGAFMAFLARVVGARIYVEIGSFTGYSALAMALPMREIHGDDARVYACDISPEIIDVARDYWREAGVEDIVEARVGRGLDSLKALAAEGLADSVDMVFIDADKEAYDAYYEEAATLLRPGGLMLLDNVLWSGKVADAAADDPETESLRAIAGKAREDGRFDAAFTAMSDGLLLLRKRELTASHIDGPDAASGRRAPEGA